MRDRAPLVSGLWYSCVHEYTKERGCTSIIKFVSNTNSDDTTPLSQPRGCQRCCWVSHYFPSDPRILMIMNYRSLIWSLYRVRDQNWSGESTGFHTSMPGARQRRGNPMVADFLLCGLKHWRKQENDVCAGGQEFSGTITPLFCL